MSERSVGHEVYADAPNSMMCCNKTEEDIRELMGFDTQARLQREVIGRCLNISISNSGGRSVKRHIIGCGRLITAGVRRCGRGNRSLFLYPSFSAFGRGSRFTVSTYRSQVGISMSRVIISVTWFSKSSVSQAGPRVIYI